MTGNIYDEVARAGIRRAGAMAAAIQAELAGRLRPGVSTAQIEAWAREAMASRGATSGVFGYNNYPAHMCVSRNAIVCNGLPSASEVLASGDIVSLDISLALAGYYANIAGTFAVGPIAPAVQRLIATTEACLAAGIAAVRAGARIGDIGAAIAPLAEKAGFGVVQDYGGHGIGRQPLEAPFVASVARAGTGLRLRPGMVFTIEPMLTLGAPRIHVIMDMWSAATSDGQPAAHCKHTVAVTESGAEVLTR